MKLKSFLYNYWKSLIIISGILYLSFAPPSTFNGVPSFEYEDKLIHILMYGALTCVLIFDLQLYAKKKSLSKFTFIFICLLIPIFLGGIVEILQPIYFAPRTAEWFDWFSDITGVLIGWLAMQFIILKIKLK